jgi:plastocyanin
MTDVTTTDEPESGAEPVPADANAAEPAEAAAPPEEPTPFWQRPLVEKFLVPLVLPVAVVVFIVVYVINVSRIFLAGHGHIPIFTGSFILATILFGSAILSAASPRMRQASITLVSVGFVMLIISSGWLLIGHAQPEKTGPTALAPDLKTTQTIKVVAGQGGNLVFSPSTLTAKTGLATVQITMGSGGHTFNFDNPTAVLWPEAGVSITNPTMTGTAFFGAAGSYTFFCNTPGHRAAGMQGTITVTGAAKTLNQAVTEAGNPPLKA